MAYLFGEEIEKRPEEVNSPNVTMNGRPHLANEATVTRETSRAERSKVPLHIRIDNR